VTEEQWRSAYRIFQAASELPEAERTAFIDTSTADAETRAQVFSLLQEDSSDDIDVPQAAEAAFPHPGTQVGRYIVRAPLGRGGMGLVCAAFDSELKRTVALKFVHRSSIGSTSRFEEFVGRAIREAQAISALNHPNIVTVHDVLRVNGEAAIVMELVDGRSLRTCASTAQAVQSVAGWGLQIARGLVAAHERGIIHRDIKPENLILRSDGLIKILDFGLARQIEVDDSVEHLPMGTLGYMSPEQIRGDHLNSSTDLFSLGVVLWELATGAHPFRADSALATTEAIARSEPDTSLPPSPLSRRFERILRRLLAPNPNDRPNAAELEHELSAFVENRRRPTFFWIAAAALVLAAAFYLLPRGLPLNDSTVPVSSPSIVPFTSYQGSETDPVFSPDGKRVAFAWTGEADRNRNLYVRTIGDENLTPLTKGPADDFAPSWSPDGKRIAFLRRSPESSNDPFVLIAPAAGGPAVVAGRIANTEGYPRPIAWWPDGNSLVIRDATDRGYSLVRLHLGDGVRTVLTAPGSGESDGIPVLAPSGRQFAFVRTRVNYAAVCLLDLSGKVNCPETVRKVEGDSINGLIGGVAWLPEDKGLFYCDKSALWRIDFLPETKVTRVMQGSFPGLTGSPAGRRLAFHKEYSDINLWQLRNGAAAPLKTINSSAEDSEPAYSPDGKSICFRSNREGSFELWNCQSDGSRLHKLTSAGGHLGSARWSPDGRWLVFDAYGLPGAGTKFDNVYVIPSSGGAPRSTPRRLTSDRAECIVPNWSNDQKFIYYMQKAGGSYETWKMPFPEGQPVRVASFGMFDVAESPDGRYLYYAKFRGQSGIFRRLVEGGPEEIVPNTNAVQLIRYWQLTPQGIYFASGPLDPKLLMVDFAANRLHTVGIMLGTLLRGSRGLAVAPGGSTAIYASEDLILNDISFIEKIF
jgi:serine/threonine protein kinase